MPYLIFCIIGSVLVSVLLKIFETQGRQRVVVIASNYFSAAVLSAVWWLVETGGQPHLSPRTWLLGAGNGLLYALAFFLFMVTASRLGLARPVSFMRLSIVLPLTASIIIWQEYPSVAQLIGVGLTVLALWLLNSVQSHSATGEGGLSWHFLLLGLGLFLAVGLADTLAKAFEAVPAAGERGGFLFVVFVTACLASTLVILIQRIPLRRSDLLAGLGLGVPNQLAVVSLLLSLAHLPAIVVFPTLNVSLVLLSTLIGYVGWREQLNRHSTVGVAFTVLALVLINF